MHKFPNFWFINKELLQTPFGLMIVTILIIKFVSFAYAQVEGR